MLVGEKPNTTIINTGSRLVSKGNSKYKIKMQDSSILGRINNDLNMVMKQVNFSLRNLCKAYGFAFICYENIDSIVHGEMVFLLQTRVRLYCPKKLQNI